MSEQSDRLPWLSAKGRGRALSALVAPRDTALLIIDVQNDFCHPDGSLGVNGVDLSAMRPMEESLAALIVAARNAGVIRVFVRATYGEAVVGTDLAEKLVSRGMLSSQCLPGSWGADWFGSVVPQDDDIVITKHRYSAFWGTPLDAILRSRRIRTVVITGVVTSSCVDSTARDAFFNDYTVVIPRECVADTAEWKAQNWLRRLEESFAYVLPAAELTASWERGGWPAPVHEDGAPSSTVLMVVGEPGDVEPERRADVSRLVRAARHSGLKALIARQRPGAHERGAGAYPGIELSDGVPVFETYSESAFAATALDIYLRANGIRRILIVGPSDQEFVNATARDAALRGYDVLAPRLAREGASRVGRSAIDLAATGALSLDPADLESHWERPRRAAEVA